MSSKSTIKEPVEFLYHIFDSISYIQKFTKKVTLAEFKENVEKQDAVVRRFEIIGEASNNVTEKIKRDNPDLPWREMKAMRNFVSHEYFGIDYEDIWKAVKSNLPPLKKQIKALIKALE
ncbi:MAG: DUF86 domain-containing protein [bacterium]